MALKLVSCSRNPAAASFFLLAGVHARGGRFGAPRGGQAGGGLEIRRRCVVFLRTQKRNILGIFRREPGEFLGAADGFFERGVIELVDRGDAGFLAVARLHDEGEFVVATAGGDGVAGKTQVGLAVAGERGLGLVGLVKTDHFLEDGLGVGFAEQRHRRKGGSGKAEVGRTERRRVRFCARC